MMSISTKFCGAFMVVMYVFLNKEGFFMRPQSILDIDPDYAFTDFPHNLESLSYFIPIYYYDNDKDNTRFK